MEWNVGELGECAVSSNIPKHPNLIHYPKTPKPQNPYFLTFLKFLRLIYFDKYKFIFEFIGHFL